MYYVDSNVLISYIFKTGEPYHNISQRFLEDLVFVKKQKLYASSLTLMETCSHICKKITKEGAKLIDQLQRYVDMYKDAKDKCKFLISLVTNFLKERLKIEFIDDRSLYDFVAITGNVMLPRIFKEAVELSYKISLRVKDLLHLVYAYLLSNSYGIRFFLTHDIENFGKIKDEVKQLLQIEVILLAPKQKCCTNS